MDNFSDDPLPSENSGFKSNSQFEQNQPASYTILSKMDKDRNDELEDFGRSMEDSTPFNYIDYALVTPPCFNFYLQLSK
jgi:hypothetical protein